MSKQPEPGRLTSGVLALAVHILFIALLLFGINWQQRVPDPLVADLWREIPPPRPQPVSRPAPEPLPPPPAPKPEAPPPEPKVEPPPEPKAQVPPAPAEPSRADIELKEKQRKLKEKKAAEELRREEARIQEQERKKEEAREREQARKQEQQRQAELKRQDDARHREEEKRQEEVRREDERRMEREAEARRSVILEEQQKLAQLARQKAEEDARKRAEAEAVSAKQRLLQQYIDRIKLKIRGRVVVPPGLSGNPKAVYSVTLLPGGEVLEIRLVKSSGVAAYDAAVERAIRASEPLPVPSEPDLFQQLREAKYEFRPLE